MAERDWRRNIGFYSMVLLILIILLLAVETRELRAIREELKQEPASQANVHILTVCWSVSFIPSDGYVRGFVANWTTSSPVRILQVDVWMGNPYDIKWEGDVILTLNPEIDLWYPPTIDEVLVHYQFDCHAQSSLPHFRSFDLRPGFVVDGNTTIHVFRLFSNFDTKDTYSGDGWIVIYYLYQEEN